MRIYGYRVIHKDRPNQVKVVVPEWKDIPLRKIMEKEVGSLAVWSDPYVEQCFSDRSVADRNGDSDSENHARYSEEEDDFSKEDRFSTLRILVDGQVMTHPGMMIVYRSLAGLYHFLSQSWEPSDDPFQQELSALFKDTRPSGPVLDILKSTFRTESRDVDQTIRKTQGGVVDHDSFISPLKGITAEAERWYFDDYPNSSQVAFLPGYHVRKGARIPAGAMLWRAQGPSMDTGLFTGFHNGDCRISQDLTDFGDLFLNAMDAATLYASCPWYSLDEQVLEAGAVLRIPSQREAGRWLKERRGIAEQERAARDHSQSFLANEEDADFRDITLPSGLPAAGFIRDSRSPIRVPENIPVLTDVGEVLAVLSRAEHGLFIADRQHGSPMRLLPQSRKTLWAVIAVPLCPFSRKGRAIS